MYTSVVGVASSDPSHKGASPSPNMDTWYTELSGDRLSMASCNEGEREGGRDGAKEGGKVVLTDQSLSNRIRSPLNHHSMKLWLMQSIRLFVLAVDGSC